MCARGLHARCATDGRWKDGARPSKPVTGTAGSLARVAPPENTRDRLKPPLSEKNSLSTAVWDESPTIWDESTTPMGRARTVLDDSKTPWGHARIAGDESKTPSTPGKLPWERASADQNESPTPVGLFQTIGDESKIVWKSSPAAPPRPQAAGDSPRDAPHSSRAPNRDRDAPQNARRKTETSAEPFSPRAENSTRLPRRNYPRVIGAAERNAKRVRCRVSRSELRDSLT